MSATAIALVSSTPKPGQAPSRPAVPSPSPGTWRHPKFTEIVSRQSASTFSDRNLKIATINAIALVMSFVFSSPLYYRLVLHYHMPYHDGSDMEIVSTVY